MNNLVSPHLVACLILGSITPLAARNHDSNPRLQENRAQITDSATRSVSNPAVSPQRKRGEISDKPAVSMVTRSSERTTTARSIHRSEGFDVLGKPTPQRRMVAATQGRQRYEVAENSMQKGLSLVSSLYRQSSRTE